MDFTAERFFDLASFPWEKIFFKDKPVWEALNTLDMFVQELFTTGVVKANYQGSDDVFIGEGTEIQEGVKITGPAIIGKNCVISHASLLRGTCLFGDNVHIGHAVEVKQSILFNGATAAHLNYIGDSIIGNNVNISGGVILANFRFDTKPVVIKTEGTVVETHREKFGSVLGDGVNIGVNAVLNPGTLLGKKVIVYPLTSVKGMHHDETIIR
jgi:UDP-N-acetylglucosamine diphosphorylase / glucose-1-phosphate thymidylyltransferase / UDP-N-acetylgalactosamine diphosphorylase / glucosamine-1-phosphate N-acetyltransferase / galactosamine-1-phosphate N-acetyltransferase